MRKLERCHDPKQQRKECKYSTDDPLGETKIETIKQGDNENNVNNHK